ncbi:MAG: hypothetical protein ACRD1S_09110 [Vicinamibacterales bacterium]
MSGDRRGARFLTTSHRLNRLCRSERGTPLARILIILAIVLSLATTLDDRAVAQQAAGAAAIQSMDVCGDSISKGVNAQSRFPCPNAEQEEFNWATSLTHGADFCNPGPEGVFSHAERIECLKGSTVISVSPNSAKSGAQMLKDFVSQATAVSAHLTSKSAPRYVPILMGHNDLCGGSIFKYNFSCPAGSDQDAHNYCRTTAAAFERELRKGLDILMTIPETHLGVASMVRVSQLCNHGAKTNCQTFSSCQNLWTAVAYLGWTFGQPEGICGSLTVNCTERRIRDAYQSAKTYHDILARVTGEYALVPPGGRSAMVVVGGQIVGGAVKAAGVTVAFSDAPWRYKFSSNQLSCCDCYHPSRAGQNVASRILFEGLTCTTAEPCCRDTGDSLADGRCAATDTDGRFYPGLFAPFSSSTTPEP